MINKYEIIIKDKYINIRNYKRVIDINDNKIEVILDKNRIIINGSNLIVCEMDEYEILVRGNIKGIDFIE